MKPKTSKAKRAKAPARLSAAELTLRRERFVQEYLADPEHNATAAYYRAGFIGADSSARTGAARWLKHPDVIAAIAKHRAALAAKFEVTREKVLDEYAKLAFVDPRKFFRDDGTLKHVTEMDERTAAALQMFEVEEEYINDDPEVELEPQPHGGGLKRAAARPLAIGRTAKIKWSGKKEALDSIVKLMGYDKEQNPAGTAANPFHMIVQDLQGRSSALSPSTTVHEDDE